MKFRIIPTFLLAAIVAALGWAYLKLDGFQEFPKADETIVDGANASLIVADEDLFDWEPRFWSWIADAKRLRAVGAPDAPTYDDTRWFRADVAPELIRRIQSSSERMAPLSRTLGEKEIVSIEAAYARIKDHTVLRGEPTPVIYFETDRLFGLSGGDGADRIYDFSNGFMVSKSDGTVYEWRSIKPKT